MVWCVTGKRGTQIPQDVWKAKVTYNLEWCCNIPDCVLCCKTSQSHVNIQLAHARIWACDWALTWPAARWQDISPCCDLLHLIVYVLHDYLGIQQKHYSCGALAGMVHREVKCTSAAVMKLIHARVDLVESYLENCSQCKLALLGWSLEGSSTLKGKKIVDCDVIPVDEGADEMVGSIWTSCSTAELSQTLCLCENQMHVVVSLGNALHL